MRSLPTIFAAKGPGKLSASSARAGRNPIVFIITAVKENETFVAFKAFEAFTVVENETFVAFKSFEAFATEGSIVGSPAQPQPGSSAPRGWPRWDNV